MHDFAPSQNGPSGEIERWIAAARQGDAEALGRLLENCRPYLLLVANQELRRDLQGKIGASDLVQETFLEARRDFSRFVGHNEEKLLGWLRQALLHNIANCNRHFLETGKRNIGREVPLSDGFSKQLCNGVEARSKSPSSLAVARERDESLRRAIELLPELQQQVIRWRNYERCRFEEIGRRLHRSAEAARKLWARAIEQLRQVLETDHESH